MILTLTPNPSLDSTIELPAPLERGEVQRAVAASAAPRRQGREHCPGPGRLRHRGTGAASRRPRRRRGPRPVPRRASRT